MKRPSWAKNLLVGIDHGDSSFVASLNRVAAESSGVKRGVSPLAKAMATFNTGCADDGKSLPRPKAVIVDEVAPFPPDHVIEAHEARLVARGGLSVRLEQGWFDLGEVKDITVQQFVPKHPFPPITEPVFEMTSIESEWKFTPTEAFLELIGLMRVINNPRFYGGPVKVRIAGE